MNGIHVAYAHRSKLLDEHYALLALLLPEPEKQRLSRFSNKSDRELSLLGKVLLYVLLKNIGYTQRNLRQLSYTEFKKPIIFDLPDVDFNISHAGNVSVVALAVGQRVGIDVEKHALIQMDDYGFVFTREEREWIGNDPTRFFMVWTRKEALIKALGKGFHHDPSRINVLENEIIAENLRFEFKPLPLFPNYTCTLALRDSKSPITIYPVLIDELFVQNVLATLEL